MEPGIVGVPSANAAGTSAVPGTRLGPASLLPPCNRYDAEDDNMGMATSNPGMAAMSLMLTSYQGDAKTAIGSTTSPLGTGRYNSQFVDELIRGLPASITGVLDITSKSTNPLATPDPFVALTLRSLVNTRQPVGGFLPTTLPIADAQKRDERPHDYEPISM